ncbi:MAG: sigma-54-dependent Fis family transcriptional regulator [Candidatus Rokuibacteriota bacterium]|nr:MAG: sigma-54-dependent Fis family transcriptional regulator [Candidatus Rokubacteria bacterium]
MAGLVLIIDDERILADSIAAYLDHHGYGTVVAFSGEDGLVRAESTSPDVAIVDVRLPGMNGIEVLRRLREMLPTVEVLMVTAHASVASAVDAMKLGAFDYVMKPVDLDELRFVVDKARAHQRMRQELTYLKARDRRSGGMSDIVGESPPIRALKEQIARVAALEGTDRGAAPTVLIRGETGTGKEMAARAIHYSSVRASGAFVEINCAAIPTALLEAELFGYERGAYTDAKTAKAGLFEAADGGTLFLDEIGHVELALQLKLLKVIEQKSVRRLGALRTKTVNVRIVTATNRDLEKAIADGEFRDDLYYRINAITLVVPTLRSRGEDIILLARHFLDHYRQQYGFPPKMLSPQAEETLLAYGWPGNVRELAHVIERAALLHAGRVVSVEHLGLNREHRAEPVVVASDGSVQVDFAAGPIVLENVERALIQAALRASGWNRARAAELLGISRETLRYRLEKFDLRPPA